MSRLPVEFFASLEARKIAETRLILWISVVEQWLRVFENRLPAAEYPVSTAKNGVGCRRDSFQTPAGLHRVAQKIGDGQPVGMVFKERKPTTLPPSEARLAPEGGNSQLSTLNEDLILTRILWLEGLEPGKNQGGEVDTFSRFIYIHGTNHEELIGQPVSHGCIRVRNADVLELFDAVCLGSLVWIG